MARRGKRKGRGKREPGRRRGAGSSRALRAGSPLRQRVIEAQRLYEAGDCARAEALCREVLRVEPRTPVALHVLGLIARRAGALEDACDLFEQAVRFAPGNADYLSNLGLVLAAAGRLTEAERAYRSALERNPESPVALNNLANLLARTGRREQALAFLKQATRRCRDNPALHFNLGNLHHAAGDLKAALACYRVCLRLAPEHVLAQVNLASACVGLNRLQAAVDACERALALRPDLAQAHNQLGVALARQGRLTAAEASLRRALELAPGYAEARENLGNVLAQLDRPGESLRFLAGAAGSAAADGAQSADLLVSRVNRQLQACSWDGLRELTRRAVERVVELGEPASPFAFMAMGADNAQQLICARNWTRSQVRVGERLPPAPAPGRSLTVGYLSTDFRDHALASLLAGVVEGHDRARLRVVGCSCGGDDGSALRRRLVGAFDEFLDLAPLDDHEAAAAIRERGVDILVDLKGYTTGARPGICALRPAPVQVRWLGQPGTMGCDWIDYILVDDHVAPAAEQRHFAETLFHLPGCYQPNDRRREMAAATPTRAACGLPRTGFVFCCFNTSYKITPSTFDCWMEILRAVSGSVLWLLAGNREMAANLRREAAARGVEATRLVFAPPLERAAHLARYRLADLFLDTFTVNACATASDVLWAGCPLLTCSGRTFAARAAGSILRAAGLPELVTASPDAYIARAVELAGAPEALGAVRARVETCREQSPLFDAARCARVLENAYERMRGRGDSER